MKLHPDQIGEPDEQGRIKVGCRIGLDLIQTSSVT